MVDSPLIQALQRFPRLQKASKIIIGFSGGLDSCVLLHACVKAFPKTPKTAVHVNHGLQEDAVQWEAHCLQVAETLSVPLEVHRVQVQTRGKGIEDAAREARYQAFDAHIKASTEVLLLGHHADDQMETFWLRILRGTGIEGLKAMPVERPFAKGFLLRPLLDLPRSALEAYAAAEQLSWVEDASNQDTHFDRNWLRHHILPNVIQRKPQAYKTLNRMLDHLDDAQGILDEVTQEDLIKVLWLDTSQLSIDGLGSLSLPRQRRVIRLWAQRFANVSLSQKQVQQIQQEVIAASSDRQPCLVLTNEVDVRRFQRRLYLLPHIKSLVEPQSIVLEAILAEVLTVAKTPTISKVPAEVMIPWSIGNIRVRFVQGQGLPLEGLEGARIVTRKQGVRLSLPKSEHSASLKQWLQEKAVAPWLRPHIPCLEVGNKVIDVAGLVGAYKQEMLDNSVGLVWEWQLPPGYIHGLNQNDEPETLEMNS